MVEVPQVTADVGGTDVHLLCLERLATFEKDTDDRADEMDKFVDEYGNG